ncbi:MAG: hypothetical protein HC933_17515 [Pleurocapsa sp. SU_196_0]|nr:hypothetical protein [Pleurocapsa sp. SU_196_0]
MTTNDVRTYLLSLQQHIIDAMQAEDGRYQVAKDLADKGELARALLERYVERERILFDDIFARADELSEDPLHSFLIALKFFAEMFENLPDAHPGCLTAAYCYQDRLFDRHIRDLNAAGVIDGVCASRRALKASPNAIRRALP